jgi:fumarylacetoacetase
MPEHYAPKSAWAPVAPGSDFPIQNLPFGVFRREGAPPRICTVIGERIVDLAVLAELGWFDDLGIERAIFQRETLNDFITLGKAKTNATRRRVAQALDEARTPWDASAHADAFMHPLTEVEMLLPVAAGDYTDFYSSREHAVNVGSLFRDPERALPDNWLYLPAGYHGRASSIVASGVPVRRPAGQYAPKPGEAPVFGPSRQLDFELEMAFVVGKSSTLGEPVPVEKAEEHIFGLLLFNDWSARDIQRWEYVPLGPFLGKNFASTVSPWVVTLEALTPFRVEGPPQNPPPLPYLRTQGADTFDIHLEAWLETDNNPPLRLCRSNYKYLYWRMRQQLAHHTVNGCNLRVGDICASGTISGPDRDGYGSLLEITRGGSRALTLPNGERRAYLEDGDAVVLRAGAEKAGARVGFGEARARILPPKRQ